MSAWARLKQFAGGTTRSFPTIASASALAINDTSNVFIVSGATAIASISTVPVRPGRIIVLHTTDTTGPAWTDTAYSATPTNGTVSLSASLTQAKGTTLTLQQGNAGNWLEIARAANG